MRTLWLPLLSLALLLGVTRPGWTQEVSTAPASAPASAPLPPLGYVVLGRDFEKLDKPLRTTPGPTGQVEVIYFFWYGSDWAWSIDRDLRRWAETQPWPIHFVPTPVVFDNAPYQVLCARIFYALDVLGEERRVGPLLMDALHGNYLDLSDVDQLLAWMDNHGVDSKAFLRAINSPRVKSSVLALPRVQTTYQVRGTPTLVLEGRYVVRATNKQTPAKAAQVAEFMADKLSKPGPRP